MNYLKKYLLSSILVLTAISIHPAAPARHTADDDSDDVSTQVARIITYDDSDDFSTQATKIMTEIDHLGNLLCVSKMTNTDLEKHKATYHALNQRLQEMDKDPRAKTSAKLEEAKFFIPFIMPLIQRRQAVIEKELFKVQEVAPKKDNEFQKLVRPMCDYIQECARRNERPCPFQVLKFKDRVDIKLKEKERRDALAALTAAEKQQSEDKKTLSAEQLALLVAQEKREEQEKKMAAMIKQRDEQEKKRQKQEEARQLQVSKKELELQQKKHAQEIKDFQQSEDYARRGLTREANKFFNDSWEQYKKDKVLLQKEADKQDQRNLELLQQEEADGRVQIEFEFQRSQLRLIDLQQAEASPYDPFKDYNPLRLK
jgi:hypothetical protein